MDVKHISQLIEDIYSAGMGQMPWSDVLAKMARARGESQAVMYERGLADGPPNILGSYNLDPESSTRYVAHYGLIDVWHRRLMASPTFEPAPTDSLIDQRELEATEFYNDFLRPLDVERGIGAMAYRGANSATLFAMQRSRRRGLFSARDQKLLSILFPHIRRSLELQNAMRRASMAAASAKEDPLLQLGLVVLAADGRVIFANRPAIDILLRMGIRMVMGRLSGARSQADGVVEAIEDAAAAGTGQFRRRSFFMTMSIDTRTEVDLVLASEDEQLAGDSEPGIAITLRLRTGTDLAGSLQSAFGLTPSEAALAVGLSQGETLAGIARSRGTSVNTVRVQLRSAFAKTGCHRQSDLMRLVLQLPRR